MKRQLFITLMLLLSTLVAKAVDFELDGIKYTVHPYADDEVLVTREGAELFDYETYIIECIPWECGEEDAYEGDVVIPSQVTYKGKTYTVTSIGVAAFSRCHNLKSVVVPETVTHIARGAFYGCENLKSVEIRGKIKNLQYETFEGCSSLEFLDLSNVQHYLVLYTSENMCDVILPYDASYYYIKGNGKKQKFRSYNPVPPGIGVRFEGVSADSELYVVNWDYSIARGWQRWVSGWLHDMKDFVSEALVLTAPEWKLDGRTLTAPASNTASVYNIDGVLSAKLEPGTSRDLAPGIYIVNCGAASGKILVE